ncbi:hypothetical protein Tco_1052683 [Tanacetum coccineum]
MQTQESKVDAGKALDANLVDTKSIKKDSTMQDESSRSGNDTDVDDADIRPIYDEEPMTEVQLIAECNIFAIGQQHTEQPEIINEGRVDQYSEQCQVKSPMLDSSPDNQTTEYSKQSLESENILLKKIVAQFQKDFSRMEAHCIALELKYQNQALKSGQHEQTTSLLANNTDLKAQIQEKVFAIVALKNNLRKLKGNSVDTKFAKTSVLGKPVLQSLRNQSVVTITKKQIIILTMRSQDASQKQVLEFNTLPAGTHFGSVVDDKVLHRVMTVVKESTFVDQWVKVVVNTKEDYTENDGCSGKKLLRDDSQESRHQVEGHEEQCWWL